MEIFVRKNSFFAVLIFLGMFFASLLGQVAYAQMPAVKSADEIFQVKAEVIDKTHFVLTWTIAKGYHLYSDSIGIKVISGDAQLAPLVLPEGKPGTDPTRGSHYMEYYEGVSVPVRLLSGTTDHLGLQVSYQGCADVGLCYPPQVKQMVLGSQNVEFADVIHDRSSASSIHDLLNDQQPWIVVGSFFIFGLLLAFTPCIFPMLPILSGILAKQGDKMTSRHGFSLSFVYVLSSALTYAVAGLIAGLAGQHLQTALQNTWVLVFSGGFFIVLALSLFGVYELRLPQALQDRFAHLSHHKTKSPYIGAGIMGIFSTLIISPCVSAPLVGALAYIGDTGSAALGGICLFVMGFGMGLPLLFIGTSAGKLLPKSGYWMDRVKNFFGLVLLGMAVWVWSRIFPGAVILGLCGVLAIMTGVYLIAMDQAKAWIHFWKALGMIVSIYGLCALIGALSGSENIFQPLDQFTQGKSSSKENLFTPVNSMIALDRALKKNQPVLLDFYADWCVSCHEMDSEVFEDPDVRAAFEKHHVRLLRVDMTKTTPEEEAILKKYQVVAPPTLLFFDQKGQWIAPASMVGKQTPETVIQQVVTL